MDEPKATTGYRLVPREVDVRAELLRNTELAFTRLRPLGQAELSDRERVLIRAIIEGLTELV